MQLTVQVMLRPTKEQASLLTSTAKEYISLINDIFDHAIAIGVLPKLSSRAVYAALPSALRRHAKDELYHLRRVPRP